MGYKEQITSRIIEILNSRFDGNKSKFGLALGLKESRIRSYTHENLKERSMPPAEFIALIVDKVEINPEWLLLGKGVMDKNNYPHILPDDEFQNMKRQINELITTNLNLSELLRKKNTARGA